MALPYDSGFAPPPLPPAQRLLAARDARSTTDYEFSFWTAFGWTLLTCGIYTFYVYFRLVERMREHNRRRLAMLEAANEIAWSRAVEQGRAEELRPRFERVAGDLAVMRQLTAEFREPWIWVIILLVAGTIGVFIIDWLLDADLIKHSAAEADAEWCLTDIFETLGAPVAALSVAPTADLEKRPHQYVPRVVVTLLTCGIYQYWWLYDLMQDGNSHFERDAAWEDALVASIT